MHQVLHGVCGAIVKLMFEPLCLHLLVATSIGVCFSPSTVRLRG